jgi:hypothetical protein
MRASLWRRGVLLSAGLLALTTLGAGPAQAAPNYCVQLLETGQSTCFATEHELLSYQDANAIPPLITMFNDAGYLGANGYKNYASAYGKTTCDYDYVHHDASSGDLRGDKFNTGLVVDNQISSMVIRAGSGCSVTIFSKAKFTGDRWRLTDSCPNFHTCANNGDLTLDFNDIISSFWVDRGFG